MGKLSGEFREPNRKDKVTRFRSVTYARLLGLLVNTLGSHLNSGLNAEYTLLLSYLLFLSLVSLVMYFAFSEKFTVQSPVLGSMILLTLFCH